MSQYQGIDPPQIFVQQGCRKPSSGPLINDCDAVDAILLESSCGSVQLPVVNVVNCLNMIGRVVERAGPPVYKS